MRRRADSSTVSQKKPPRSGLIRRFRRDKKGATAVEFGLVAIPFFALLFAIIETFLLFFASQAIETATTQAGRLIRTGQAQTTGTTADGFVDQMCAVLNGVFNCDNIMVDVRTYATFDEVDLGRPIDDEGNLNQDEFIYDPGEGGDIVVVRAFYEWPIFTNLLGLGLANLANGKNLIASTTAFRNEPF